MTKLSKVSVRFVGVYLRINEPYNHAVVPPPPSPCRIDLPTINTGVDEPRVFHVMNGIASALSPMGYDLQFQDNPGIPGVLNRVSFSATDGSFSYSLDAIELMEKTGITFAWQYYLFDKNLNNAYDDQRIPVFHRALYGSKDSPVIQDNYRIIWRLVPIAKEPNVGSKVNYTPVE